MISTYLLGVKHGRPSADLREQILRSMRFALSQQVRPDGMFAVSPAAQGEGALTASAIDRSVRIDYVQHVCSAMLRAAALLDAGAAR
jgi:hypothetical protein